MVFLFNGLFAILLTRMIVIRIALIYVTLSHYKFLLISLYWYLSLIEHFIFSIIFFIFLFYFILFFFIIIIIIIIIVIILIFIPLLLRYLLIPQYSSLTLFHLFYMSVCYLILNTLFFTIFFRCLIIVMTLSINLI